MEPRACSRAHPTGWAECAPGPHGLPPGAPRSHVRPVGADTSHHGATGRGGRARAQRGRHTRAHHRCPCASTDRSFAQRAIVTIADTGSCDGTGDVARHLAASVPGVGVLLLTRSDNAHALRMAVAASQAEVVACVDTASPSMTAHLVSVVGSVLSGRGEFAVATSPSVHGRAAHTLGDGPPAWFRRRLARLRGARRSHRSPSGPTAIRRSRALEILPLVTDAGRSLSAELVVAATCRGRASPRSRPLDDAR